MNGASYIKNKIEEVELIVKDNRKDNLDTVRGFADEGQTNTKCHPQNMNIETWSDIEYDFL